MSTRIGNPNVCPECGSWLHYKTRRLVLWMVGPAARMAAHVCPECFERFENKGRCMSALPRVWNSGGAKARAEGHGLGNPLQPPLRRHF
jgi:predicted RNA-binding Zn-ribbon protein involved in translation (DUF1610 family)